MSDIPYAHYYALIPFCDSALSFADQVCIHFHFRLSSIAYSDTHMYMIDSSIP